MLSMANVGLMIIVAGWVIQLGATSKKTPAIQRQFLYCYIVGASLLALSTLAELNFGTVLNAVTALIAFMTLKKLSSKK